MMYKQLFPIILLGCFCGSCVPVENKSHRIEITTEMLINETGSGNHLQWFDEQDLTLKPETRWATSGNTNCWPAGLVIDLQGEYQIDSICVFDAEKSYRVEGGALLVSCGKPFEWTDSIRYELRNEGKWEKVIFPVRTRFIHLVKEATVKCNLDGEFPENCDLAINEIVIFGKLMKKALNEKKRMGIRPEPTTMDKFIGMNAYINTNDKLYEAVGSVREYRPWRWNGVASLSEPISWEPLRDGDSDEYYAKLRHLDVDCLPCIHRHVLNEASEQIPNFGKDPNDPESYRLMADYSYQYIARYGSKTVPERLLRTTEPSPKKSGMNLIRYYENWNEENREWGDPMTHFTPYMFAAFCSASYDGHMGIMGEGYGVKAADPDVKFVFGGLAGLSLSYIQAMKLWADYYRKGSFPADVLNVHHYCNTRGMQHPKEIAYGISPEEDHFKEKITELVKWRNENLPDKELWLTEIGWDTTTKSYQSAGKGHKLFPDHISMFEIQAMWLVRAYLIGSAAGLDRMMMYLANDIEGYTANVYGNCGFITVDKELKTSFYYVKTMKNTLKGMVFDGDCTSDENVWVYRYKDPSSGRVAYVLWCPTSDGTHVENYTLALKNANVQKVVQVSLEDKKEDGVHQDLFVRNGSVEINVNERPVFIIVD